MKDPYEEGVASHSAPSFALSTVRRLVKRKQGGAADKAANLAGCESPCRQLPVFGRLAYPMHAEVTKHVLLGCKSLSCPAAVSRRGRYDLGGEQTRRLEH